MAVHPSQEVWPCAPATNEGLHYALLDSAGTDEARARVFQLRRKVFNRFAIGNFLRTNQFDRWPASG